MKKEVYWSDYDYTYTQKLVKRYSGILFIPQKEIYTNDEPEKILELVKMVDEVLVINEHYKVYELAAFVLNKKVFTKEDYPVDAAVDQDEDEDEE